LFVIGITLQLVYIFAFTAIDG